MGWAIGWLVFILLIVDLGWTVCFGLFVGLLLFYGFVAGFVALRFGC